MARKSLQGLSGIAKTIADSAPSAGERKLAPNAPALGALQGSLSAIREIDPSLIDEWGPKDRLDEFTAVNSGDDTDGFSALRSSIQDGGQRVPILVRQSSTEGRFEVIYGRRRLQACRELGIKVRANVENLDDAAALLAKGLENAARRNLSFYEKARFAAVIRAAGHNTKTIRQVLGLTAPGLSHLVKVTDNVPDDVGDAIGSAPKAGRPKWSALADAFAAKKVTASMALSVLGKLDRDLTSDDRLDRLLAEVARRGARPNEGRAVMPAPGVTIKSNKSSVTLAIKKTGKDGAFGAWLDQHLEDIITKSYSEFTVVNSKDDNRGLSRKEDGK